MKQLRNLLICTLVLCLVLPLAACSASKEDMGGMNNAYGDAYPPAMDDAMLPEGAPEEGNEEEKVEGEIQFVENPFVETAQQAVSTFSADVDTASYSYLRKLINNGYTLQNLLPMAYAFRTEEMVNYFRYDVPTPREGELFGMASEIVPCPWNAENALMRLTLVRHTRSHMPGEDAALEWRKYRFCGAVLLAMNLALTVFTLYFVYRIRIFRHHEITTIAMAAYTFTALTVAIVNAVRYKRYGSPACSAAKAISLAAATVSMLTLENAMLTTFGEERSEAFRQIILGASGVAVICVVQGIALYMIVNATRKLRLAPEKSA